MKKILALFIVLAIIGITLVATVGMVSACEPPPPPGQIDCRFTYTDPPYAELSSIVLNARGKPTPGGLFFWLTATNMSGPKTMIAIIPDGFKFQSQSPVEVTVNGVDAGPVEFVPVSVGTAVIWEGTVPPDSTIEMKIHLKFKCGEAAGLYDFYGATNGLLCQKTLPVLGP